MEERPEKAFLCSKGAQTRKAAAGHGRSGCSCLLVPCLTLRLSSCARGTRGSRLAWLPLGGWSQALTPPDSAHHLCRRQSFLPEKIRVF